MSREGYERLLDGPDTGLATLVGSNSLSTTPTARGQSLATTNTAKFASSGTAVSLTASALVPGQAAPTAPDTQQHQPAAAPLDSAPDALSAWKACGNLLSLWLGVSVGTFILSLLTFHLGVFAAVCGIVGSMQISYYRGADIAGAVKGTHILALLTIVFSVFSTIVTLAFSAGLSRQCGHEWRNEAELCSKLADMFFLCALWYGIYTALSYQVAKRVRSVRRLLNPVTSGAIAV